MSKIPGSADKFPVEAAALAAPSAAIRMVDGFAALKQGAWPATHSDTPVCQELGVVFSE